MSERTYCQTMHALPRDMTGALHSETSDYAIGGETAQKACENSEGFITVHAVTFLRMRTRVVYVDIRAVKMNMA